MLCATSTSQTKELTKGDAATMEAENNGKGSGDGRGGQRGDGPCGAGLALAHGHDSDTTTPIEHVVVIFQENVSFDHYFATYPNATNPAGEPFFQADDDTPTVNGLTGRAAEQ